MVVVSFILVLIIFLDLNVFIYADPKFCKSKPKGNTDCIYKCHCLNDAPCDETNGSCGDQSNCSPGWIGPGCQYSNLAYTSRDNSNQNYIVTDGGYKSCSMQNRFTIKLQRAYHISSFTVFAYDDSSKMVTRALVKNSTIEDINIVNTCLENKTMFKTKDFICTHTIFGRFLILEFENNADICEIGIHGGKNIALWKSATQSSTLNPYTSDKAVDGNTGNYKISSDSCTHTSGDESRNKPYWKVVFNQAFLIQRVVIYFRDENYLFRASNFSVVSIMNGAQLKMWQKRGKPFKKEEIVLPEPILVTNLQIELPNTPSTDSVLSLCEVQVFACRLGPDGNVCSNLCPIQCNPRYNQDLCKDLTCPVNFCFGKLHGKFCLKKECSKSDLILMNLKSDSTSCSQLACLSGQNINVQCVKGYTPKGLGSITCGNDGKWSNDTTCEANTCILLKGEHLHTNVTGKNYVKFGTTIMNTCDPGYQLKIPMMITCQFNGTWNYKGMHTASVCEEKTCILPKIDDHTYINISSVQERIKFGTSIQVKCSPGYKLNIPSTLFCQHNGTWNIKWNRSSSVCEEKTCDLPKDKHSVTNVTKDEGKVHYGTAIMISCDKDFDLKGPVVTYCQPNGTWNPGWNKSVSLCEEKIKCHLPNDTHTITNITSDKQKVAFGTPIRITCNLGYRLNGQEETKCIINGSWDGYEKAPFCVKDTKDGTRIPYVTIGVGIGITVFMVIILIVVIILFMKRRKKDNQKSQKAKYMETNEASAGNVYCSIQETEIVTETELTNDDTAREPSGYYTFLPNKTISKNAIKVENFINYVEDQKGKNGLILFQFSSLLTGLQCPAKVACFQQNKSKNKYKNIYAYDTTRVVLNRPKEKSDYINASYINGYDSVKRYVASQGPMKGTEEDFWEMVYQLHSDKIVMLTNVFEEGKQKCVQYWPDENISKFGTMSVQLISVDRYADFTVRLLSIKQDGSEWRKIRQFHFTAWPDRGVPKYASSLVQFRHKVLSMPTKGKGPLIVHCSAGIGRTGTFIALDILVAQARSTGQVDVYTSVETLRRQRVNMVQTAEQYLFLHHALEEALMCKTTATAASEFPELYIRMQQSLQDERRREIDKEFQTLNKTSPVLQEEEFANGKTSQNKKKNRYSNILPVESHRIYLCSYVPGRSDYINAVLLPSYKESKAFIATQMPLPDTVIDFLCLVYENDVSSILMLNEMDDKKTIGRYWPENEDALNVGPFTVTKSGEENMNCMIIKQLKIQYESQEPRVVNQFQVKFWPDNEMVPSSVSDILTVMEHVQQWQRKAGGHNPVVVHCMNGCDKTGLYCVVEATIERLKIEQDVGIQQIIKQMRSRRPQIIPCIEQFEFCHEAVLEYMQQNETYSNFR